VAYPGKFREITLDDAVLRVTSPSIFDFPGMAQTATPARLATTFDQLLRGIIESAAEDLEQFADYANGFSLERSFVEAHKVIIQFLGKIANRITLGQVGRLLLCRAKIPAALRGTPVKELFLTLVRNIYAGEEHFSPETETAIALRAVTARLQPLIGKKIPGGDLPAFVQSLIYDESNDQETEITL
jgi:hypothetical protein